MENGTQGEGQTPEQMPNPNGDQQPTPEATPAPEGKSEREIELEAQIAKLTQENGGLKRENTKFKKGNKPSGETGNTTFDYGKLAYLGQMGIDTTDAEQMQLIENAVESSGKELNEIISSKWFKEDLESLKAKQAMPNQTGRTGNTAKDDVDYYIAKGEMPPADKPELRKQYLEKKIKSSESKGKFTDTPIANK